MPQLSGTLGVSGSFPIHERVATGNTAGHEAPFAEKKRNLTLRQTIRKWLAPRLLGHVVQAILVFREFRCSRVAEEFLYGDSRFSLARPQQAVVGGTQRTDRR